MLLNLTTFAKDYLCLYTIFDAMCIVLLIITFYRMRYGTVKVPHADYVSKIIYPALVVIILNDIWNWISIAHISGSLTLGWSINILYFVFMQILYFDLFLYFHVSIINKPVDNKKSFLMSIPCIFMIIVNSTDFLHKTIFYVTDDLQYVRGPFYIFEYIIAYTYLLIPYVYALKNVIKSRMEGIPPRKIQRNVLTMPATIGTMALIGMWATYAPAFSMAVALTILFLYVDLLEDFVTIDPITTLYTKTEFMGELKNRMAIQNANNRNDLYLIMVDILHIRDINDKYGHTEGDALIRRIAMILQRKTSLGDKINIYASRFRGDVFCVLINSENSQEIMEYCTNLQTRVTKSDTISMAKYHTEIMYGFSRYEHGETVPEFINKALNNLELNKFKYNQLKENINKKET